MVGTRAWRRGHCSVRGNPHRLGGVGFPLGSRTTSLADDLCGRVSPPGSRRNPVPGPRRARAEGDAGGPGFADLCRRHVSLDCRRLRPDGVPRSQDEEPPLLGVALAYAAFAFVNPMRTTRAHDNGYLDWLGGTRRAGGPGGIRVPAVPAFGHRRRRGHRRLLGRGVRLAGAGVPHRLPGGARSHARWSAIPCPASRNRGVPESPELRVAAAVRRRHGDRPTA